jgi:hypothetical protein
VAIEFIRIDVVLGLIFLKHISNAFEATASIYRVASP